VFKSLLEQKYELAISNSILNEYEEKIGEHWHPEVAQSVVRTLLELPNVIPTLINFELNLISSDPDDNKFTDCAFASNSRYLVSNDKDFSILNTIDFPKIEVLKMADFKQVIESL
jgi:putative PIN family toxin of toxin-antitoxin system